MLQPIRSRPDMEASAAPSLEGTRLDPIVLRLVKGDRIALEDARRATLLAAEGGERVGALLVRMHLVRGVDWAAAAAEEMGLEVAAAESYPAAPVLADLLSPRFLRQAGVLPLSADAERVRLAMVDPTDEQTIRAVRLATRLEVVPVAATPEDVARTTARWFDGGGAALQRLARDVGEGASVDLDQDVERLIDSAQEAPVVRLVSQLLSDALRVQASDIHVEPYRDHLRVRYRVHGRLREIGAPPVRLAAAIISRIKILAKLDIAERRLPQDGRARIDLDDRRVDLRVATVPTTHGESLTIRLLDTGAAGVQLDGLGLDPAVRRRLERKLASPHGMMLVTGPTGSGKTTTLYAALRGLNRAAAKLVSIEDPVEYQIDGVTQIQVRPDIGLDFARVLRSVVRHDPDIIMVGETRDPETAEIAVHAALTGHLLLSTLHTNSAAGAFARLLDMGVEPYLLASVVKAVVGQRLVGILCPHCKVPHAATQEERRLLERAGMPLGPDAALFEEAGCPRCDGIGFVGRMGIFELLEVDDQVRELIRGRSPTQTILARALEAGMRTMAADGMARCLEGVTTLEEVLRVTEEG
jgi:general secretion pathway protein E